MVCEQILGKLSEFDTSGKTIEYVDIEWHEAFKKIHKKTTDHGRFAVLRNFMTFRGFERNTDEIAVDLIEKHNPAMLVADQDALL